MKFQFESFADLLHMSGHGSYVWAAYLVTFCAVCLLIYIPHKLKRQIVAQVERQQKIEKPVHQREHE